MAELLVKVPRYDASQKEIEMWRLSLHRNLTGTGAIAWGRLDFVGSDLADLETRQHSDLTSIGIYTHTELDTHVDNATIHFLETDIDHVNIQNIGTNSHDDIDTHIANSTIHYTVASIDHGSIAGLGDDDHTQYILANGTRAIRPTSDSTTAFQFKDQAGNVDFNYDSTNGYVGIGTSAPDTTFHIKGTSNPSLRIESTDASDPFLSFKTSNTPNQIDIWLDESDTFDELTIQGRTGGVDTRLRLLSRSGQLPLFVLTDGTNSANWQLAPDGSMGFNNLTHGANVLFRVEDAGGTAYEVFRADGTPRFIVNNSNDIIDSQFKGTTDNNLLFLDAGTDRVGIGTNVPGEKLEVVGNIFLKDNNSSIYGTGKDAKIYYDGTDLIIDPDVVGSGKALIGTSGDDTLIAGNVGIGTASPSATSLLHIDHGNNSRYVRLNRGSNSYDNMITFLTGGADKWYLGLRSVSPADGFHLYSADLGKDVISVNETNNDIILAGPVDLGSDGGATNYAEFKSDGELNLHGTARVIKHEHIPVNAIKKGAANPPGESTIGNTSVLLFDSATDEDVYYVIHLPVDWASGTDLNFHFHWAPTDANAGDVVWAIDYRISKSESNELISGTDATISTTDSTQSLQYEHLQSSDITISGASLETGDKIAIRIYRDADNAADTYGADAALFLPEMTYTADKLGEAT